MLGPRFPPKGNRAPLGEPGPQPAKAFSPVTYRQPPVCRRGGCGTEAEDRPGDVEGDRGWCDRHRAEVRATRSRLTVGVKSGKAGHRFTPTQSEPA